MPNLKQGTLSFASAKQSNTISNGKLQQKTLATEKGKNKRADALVEVKSNPKASETLEMSSEEEATSTEISVPAKRAHASTKRRISSGNTKQALSQPPQSGKQEPSLAGIEGNHLDVKDKAGRYRKYYNEVRLKTEHIPPIHAEGQNRIHQMLRFFDMSYEFGPCIGMTRLQRWKRAEALGLDPPVEVRDILLTKEGIENAEYVQCVLNGEV